MVVVVKDVSEKKQWTLGGENHNLHLLVCFLRTNMDIFYGTRVSTGMLENVKNEGERVSRHVTIYQNVRSR